MGYQAQVRLLMRGNWNGGYVRFAFVPTNRSRFWVPGLGWSHARACRRAAMGAHARSAEVGPPALYLTLRCGWLKASLLVEKALMISSLPTPAAVSRLSRALREARNWAALPRPFARQPSTAVCRLPATPGYRSPRRGRGGSALAPLAPRHAQGERGWRPGRVL